MASGPGTTDLPNLTPRDRVILTTAASEFEPEVTYLNTATMGLPPHRSWTALQEALHEWRSGRFVPTSSDTWVARARTAYANLVNVNPSEVAIGSQVSPLVGLIAAALPAGCEVLTAIGDFTSVLFPLHVQAARGVRVREVPLGRLADAVGRGTSLVAFSAVQSADGRVADLDAIEEACAETGTQILVDVTQAVGWLPVDASRYSYTVSGGYKWLLAPRGTAYLTVQSDLVSGLLPLSAGWYAGADAWESTYGTPLRLASDARRFDVSPVWYSWIGAAPALDLLLEVGPRALHAHSVELANRFCTGVGLQSTDSAIVSVFADAEAARLMHDAGIVASVRGGRLRLSFHLCNTYKDVDRAVEVLVGHVRN